jgi:hypothetical protein
MNSFRLPEINAPSNWLNEKKAILLLATVNFKEESPIGYSQFQRRVSYWLQSISKERPHWLAELIPGEVVCQEGVLLLYVPVCAQPRVDPRVMAQASRGQVQTEHEAV